MLDHITPESGRFDLLRAPGGQRTGLRTELTPEHFKSPGGGGVTTKQTPDLISAQKQAEFSSRRFHRHCEWRILHITVNLAPGHRPPTVQAAAWGPAPPTVPEQKDVGGAHDGRTYQRGEIIFTSDTSLNSGLLSLINRPK